MSGAVIMQCSCHSPYQDSKYGKGNRVHTLGKDGSKATCTVCGKEQHV